MLRHALGTNMSTAMTVTAMAEGVLPRSYLRPLLLIALGGAPGHGYDLIEELILFGLNVDLAGVYRMLRTLEFDGFVDASWEPSSFGPPRRVYELSATGIVARSAALAELTAARDCLDRVIAASEVVR